MEDNKRNRSTVFIVEGLTKKQASELFTEIVLTKQKVAPCGRATGRIETSEARLTECNKKRIRG